MAQSSFSVFLLCVVVLLSCQTALAGVNTDIVSPSDRTAYAHVVASGQDLKLREGMPSRDGDAVAWGSFQDRVHTNGWGIFHVNTSSHYSNQQQGEAAGMIEGALTQHLVYAAYQNFVEFFFKGDPHQPSAVNDWVSEQLKWIDTQVASNQGDTFWSHVGASLSQIRGLARGYNETAPSSEALLFEDVYMLTNAGDLEDLLVALPSSHQLSKKPHSCSGMVALSTKDARDAFTGHTTFNAYPFMLRIYKHYNMNLHGAKATSVSFSSRPADLESKDDFWTLNSGLVVLETSLSVFNKTLYQALSKDTLPAWVRVLVANRMASTPQEWVKLFSSFNSGTHNNQWVVNNLANVLSTKNKSMRMAASSEHLPPGTVWMLEQMPGHLHSEDVTHTLFGQQGYVASYNCPYFDDIFVISGYKQAGYSYHDDVRAKMFRRDAQNIATRDDMMRVMNANAPNDTLSGGTPCNAISARCDLQEKGAYAFGGIDSKVVSVLEPVTVARSGPSHDNQPVFDFTEWKDTPHAGMPERWDFDWMEMPAEWSVKEAHTKVI